MTLPEFCVHRTVEDLPHVTHEKAQPGMAVVYRPEHGKAEVGIIQQVRPRNAGVLYLGDHTPKMTNLADLHFWEGPTP